MEIINSTGDSFDDSLSKDAWKSSKALTNDKYSKVSAGSFEVLEALASTRIVFKNQSDFESFKSLYLKAMESPHTIVRQAAAKCMARATLQLTKLSQKKAEEASQSHPKKSTSKNSRSEADDEDENDDRQSPAPTGNHSKGSKHSPFYSLSFNDVLSLLASCYLHSNSLKLRVGVTQTLTHFLFMADPKTVESNYSEICHTLLTTILGNPSIRSTKHKSLSAKKNVVFVLNDIIACQILGEYGQIDAIKTLTSEFLSKYPAKDGYSVPTKETLIGALETVTGLIGYLGSAISSVSDTLKTHLLEMLKHNSYSVRISTAMCFKSLLIASPSHIVPLLSLSLNHITKELQLLAKKESSASKITGYAYLSSVIVSLTNAKSEYSSLDLTSRVLTTATSLLKSNGNVDVLSVQIQIAWLLVSGLMPLGPNFVKVHLSQLLLLWKNALHKPAGREQSEKSTLELNYHLHVRYFALSCIVAFLKYNHKLVTADVGRRIGVMLQNTTTFLSSIPSKRYHDDDPSHQIDRSLTLHDYDLLVRKRILQAYLYLSKHSHAPESFPANVLTSALATFADPDKSIFKMSSSIAASSGALDSIWEIGDNSAFGVTSKVDGFEILDKAFPESLKNKGETSQYFDDKSKHWITETSWQGQLERQIKTPILGSPEFDASLLLENQLEYTPQKPVPVATSLVDLSIEIFAILLPTQTPKVLESILDQLRSYASNALDQGQKKTDQKTAVAINSATTIYTALKYAESPKNHNKDSLKNPKVIKIFVDIIKKALSDSDPYTRNMASQSMGMLCSLGGSTVTTEHIKYLIDEIVANRDPNARGGCSLALGYILKYVGGMFAGLHLKTILGILVSLAGDPHPTVHFWALEAICITIESSGLSFSNYISSTLSTLNKLYVLESHGDEMSSSTSNNMDVEYPTTRVIARCVRALINVLGPDLKESTKSRGIVLPLVQYFELSDSTNIAVEAYRSLQELIIFTPDDVNITAFAQNLCKDLLLPSMSPLRTAAIDSIYQLIRTQSTKIFDYTGKDLEVVIWLAYNQSPDNKEIERFIVNWLEFSAENEPFEWVSRIQAVLLKPRSTFQLPSQKNIPSAATQGENDVDLEDEEGASFAANSNGRDGSGKEDDGVNQADEPLKWQTRALAVTLLRKLVNILLSEKSINEKENSPLVRRVGDLIKLAFSASTASVVELRLLGLRLLDDILSELKDLVDPDFQEVALLEQYQAQIGSALTPAFSAESSPELAFQAIKVCATFIGSGIIKNVDRMGRILKLLTNALESCSSSQIHLGELKTPSPNAQVMLRVAVLSLWAELQVSSISPGKEYLVDVVGPYVSTLVPLWISALRDFAKLRFEPEQYSGLSSSSGSIDQMYSALSRTSVLPIYQESWLQLVDAIASLIEKDNKLVFEILDEKERAATEADKEEGIKYSNEPAAFFFVLFGLCFEALVRPQQSTTESRLKVLRAFQRILHPSVSGSAIYKDVVFAETVDVLDRMVLTGNVHEQQAVVQIAASLCLNHPSGVKQESEDSEEHISEGTEQLFELFRVVMLSLTNLFPFLADSEQTISKYVTEDEAHLSLIRTCLDSLVSMIQVFPNIIKIDLYSCLLYVFGRLLEDGRSQNNIVPYSLGVQKKLLNMMVQTAAMSKEASSVVEQAVITSICHIISLLKTADLSETGLVKRKNCLLSTVVVLNTSSDIITSKIGFLHDLSTLLIENMNIPEISVVTAECTRTLLASSVNNNVGRVLAEDVIPSLVSMATNSGNNQEEGEKKPKQTMQSKLVNDILVGFAKSLKSTDKVVSGFSLVLPTLIQFIGDRGSEMPPEERLEYSKERLIELASFDGASFKKVVQGGLSDWQSALLERVLRGDGDETGDDENNNETDSSTHIQLKSFG